MQFLLLNPRVVKHHLNSVLVGCISDWQLQYDDCQSFIFCALALNSILCPKFQDVTLRGQNIMQLLGYNPGWNSWGPNWPKLIDPDMSHHTATFVSKSEQLSTVNNQQSNMTCSLLILFFLQEECFHCIPAGRGCGLDWS